MNSVIALISLALLTIGTTASGMGAPRPQIPDAPPDSVQPFHDHFEELAETFGAALMKRSISYQIKTFYFTSAVGICRYSSGSVNTVELSKSAWQRNNDTFKEMLVFHELGHCLLGRGHDNGRHSDGRPESLMNSYLFNQQTYLQYRDEYWKELFTVLSARGAWGRSQSEDSGVCTFGHE